MNTEELLENFALLLNWEERYRYIIDLGRKLPPLPEIHKTEDNRVRGCQSQVWLISEEIPAESKSKIRFTADSDAHIVRGLLKILLVMYSERSSEEILKVNAKEVFAQLGLDKHLSASRANGLTAMVQRMRAAAAQALVESN